MVRKTIVKMCMLLALVLLVGAATSGWAATAPAKKGAVCGVIAGMKCPEGQACKYPSNMCNVADLSGTCVKVAATCPKGGGQGLRLRPQELHEPVRSAEGGGPRGQQGRLPGSEAGGLRLFSRLPGRVGGSCSDPSQILIDRVEHRAHAPLAGAARRRAVEDKRDGEGALGIGEAGRRAVAAVAEGAGGGVMAVTVGHRLRPVLDRVDDEPQPPVEDMLEGGVDHPDAMGRGEGLDRLRQQDPLPLPR